MGGRREGQGQAVSVGLGVVFPCAGVRGKGVGIGVPHLVSLQTHPERVTPSHTFPQIPQTRIPTHQVMGSTMRAREVMVACMVSKSSVPRTLLKMADPTPNRMGAQIMRWSNQENLATLPVGVGCGVEGGGWKPLGRTGQCRGVVRVFGGQLSGCCLWVVCVCVCMGGGWGKGSVSWGVVRGC